jgi:hypothetical protein
MFFVRPDSLSVIVISRYHAIKILQHRLGAYALAARRGIFLTTVLPHHLHYAKLGVGLGVAFTAWTLGLRHAFDADHISAIDNVTRKLMSEHKRPLGTGFFFALGHSAVVIAVGVHHRRPLRGSLGHRPGRVAVRQYRGSLGGGRQAALILASRSGLFTLFDQEIITAPSAID